MVKIAIIAGDGIGREVTREALKVLRTVVRKFRLDLTVVELDYGAERYLQDGTTLPAGEIDRLRRDFDAIFLGALGDPRIPDMRHGKEILLAIRRDLDLFINLRPVHCLHDRLCPLKNKTARDIDFVVLRENTEGLYADVGRFLHKGTSDEIAINEDINTRGGVERIIRAAFQYAERHRRPTVTMVDKANVLRHAHDLWQRTFAIVSEEFPHVKAEHLYIDAMMALLLKTPERFAVIVTNNMFGDIITDLSAQLQGGLGMAASANLGVGKIALFEPIHGSAPDLTGKILANPIAAILSFKMLLEYLDLQPAARTVANAVQQAINENCLTVDVGGNLATDAVGDFIASAI
jgi:3-isopropylmalate dehydrogenase